MSTFMLISLYVISDFAYISSAGIERISAREYVVSGFVGDTVLMPCEVDPYRDYGKATLVYRFFDILKCGKVSSVTWSKNAPSKVKNKYEDGSDMEDPGAAWNVHLDFENPHRTSLLNNYSAYLELNGLTVEDEGTYVCNVTYINEHCNSLFVTKLYALNFIDLDLMDRVVEMRLCGKMDIQERTFFAYNKRKWLLHSIPYQIDASFSESDRKAIKSAIEEINSRTFIKFTERQCSPSYDLVSIKKRPTCETTEGRENFGSEIFLSPACCKERGIILHLLLHTLGIRHEHQRPDRDEYITVNWNNIMHDYKHLFIKYEPTEADSLGLDYNYKSVMHFPSTLYAKDKSIAVLSPKDSNVSAIELGEGFTDGYLTKLDVDGINKVYSCKPGKYYSIMDA